MLPLTVRLKTRASLFLFYPSTFLLVLIPYFLVLSFFHVTSNAESTRKEPRGEWVFSNRISYCGLGNSRRIEITHYIVMSDTFTVVPART